MAWVFTVCGERTAAADLPEQKVRGEERHQAGLGGGERRHPGRRCEEDVELVAGPCDFGDEHAQVGRWATTSSASDRNDRARSASPSPIADRASDVTSAPRTWGSRRRPRLDDAHPGSPGGPGRGRPAPGVPAPDRAGQFLVVAVQPALLDRSPAPRPPRRRRLRVRGRASPGWPAPPPATRMPVLAAVSAAASNRAAARRAGPGRGGSPHTPAPRAASGSRGRPGEPPQRRPASARGIVAANSARTASASRPEGSVALGRHRIDQRSASRGAAPPHEPAPNTAASGSARSPCSSNQSNHARTTPPAPRSTWPGEPGDQVRDPVDVSPAIA